MHALVLRVEVTPDRVLKRVAAPWARPQSDFSRLIARNGRTVAEAARTIAEDPQHV